MSSNYEYEFYYLMNFERIEKMREKENLIFEMFISSVSDTNYN